MARRLERRTRSWWRDERFAPSGTAMTDQSAEGRAAAALQINYPSREVFLEDFDRELAHGRAAVQVDRPLPRGERVELRVSFPGLRAPLRLRGAGERRRRARRRGAPAQARAGEAVGGLGQGLQQVAADPRRRSGAGGAGAARAAGRGQPPRRPADPRGAGGLRPPQRAARGLCHLPGGERQGGARPPGQLALRPAARPMSTCRSSTERTSFARSARTPGTRGCPSSLSAPAARTPESARWPAAPIASSTSRCASTNCSAPCATLWSATRAGTRPAEQEPPARGSAVSSARVAARRIRSRRSPPGWRQ